MTSSIPERLHDDAALRRFGSGMGVLQARKRRLYGVV
jgi:hypothetical protein